MLNVENIGWQAKKATHSHSLSPLESNLISSWRLKRKTDKNMQTASTFFFSFCRQMAASFLLFSVFASLSSFSFVYAAFGLSPPPTPINHDLYHYSDDLIEQIKSLVHRHPEKLSIETLKAGNEGYDAEITVVTYRQGGKESDDKSKFRILLSFGQHARELITSEVALEMLSVLSEEQILPKMDRAVLNDTLENLVIKVVPLENLNGRKIVEAGDLCERRNGRGVDLNRNWGVDWGKKEEDYDPYEENPGTAPFSEPESQIMRELATSFHPHMWVNVHSGKEALYMPYDHKNSTPEGLASQQMKVVLEELNNVNFNKRCSTGSGGFSVGYLAHGTTTDYMYDVVKVPMSFTFEIYGNRADSTEDCYKLFNPLDHATFKRVVNEWCSAFFVMFKLGQRELDVHSTGNVVRILNLGYKK